MLPREASHRRSSGPDSGLGKGGADNPNPPRHLDPALRDGAELAEARPHSEIPTSAGDENVGCEFTTLCRQEHCKNVRKFVLERRQFCIESLSCPILRFLLPALGQAHSDVVSPRLAVSLLTRPRLPPTDELVGSQDSAKSWLRESRFRERRKHNSVGNGSRFAGSVGCHEDDEDNAVMNFRDFLAEDLPLQRRHPQLTGSGVTT